MLFPSLTEINTHHAKVVSKILLGITFNIGVQFGRLATDTGHHTNKLPNETVLYICLFKWSATLDTKTSN